MELLKRWTTLFCCSMLLLSAQLTQYAF